MASTKRKPVKITSQAVKAYVDAAKNETVLLGPVDRWLQLQPNVRDTTVIHPSEMAQEDWCQRATWHRLMGRSAKPETLRLRTNLIFSAGHDIHSKWQQWLTGMGVLWGRWQCGVCEASMLGWSDEIGSRCPLIEGPHQWAYKEVPVFDTDTMVSGHADGIINPSGEENFLLEVKSVGPGTMRSLRIMSDDDADELSSSKFSRINQPERKHILQAQIYLRLAQEYVPQIGAVDRGVVLYEHKADQQAKEFVIGYNPRWTEPLFETAADIAWAVKNGRDLHCIHGGCPRCKAYEE